MHLTGFNLTANGTSVNTPYDTLNKVVAAILSTKNACVKDISRRLSDDFDDPRRLTYVSTAFNEGDYSAQVATDACTTSAACTTLLSSNAPGYIKSYLCSVNNMCDVTVTSVTDLFVTTTPEQATTTTEDNGGLPLWVWFVTVTCLCCLLGPCLIVVALLAPEGRGSTYGSYPDDVEEQPLMHRQVNMQPTATVQMAPRPAGPPMATVTMPARY